jgi:hypothetical protein
MPRVRAKVTGVPVEKSEPPLSRDVGEDAAEAAVVRGLREGRGDAAVAHALRDGGDPALVLSLQRGYGNAAVARAVLARNKTKAPPKQDAKKGFRDAITAGDYDKAALALYLAEAEDVPKLLKPLSDQELNDLDAALTRQGTLAPFAAPMAELHRYVSFCLHDPGKAKNTKQATIKDEGNLDASAKVPGGNAYAYTDVKLKGEDASHSNFAFVYKGKHASHTRWLQFIWREIVVDHPQKGTFAVDQTVTTSGGTYKLTTDPGKPVYNTDSSDPNSPFYEAGFMVNRTGDKTTIIDEPSLLDDITDAQIDDGATRIAARAHFTAYLVRDMEVMQRFDLTVEWIVTNKTVPPRSHSLTNSAAVDKLDAEMRKVLVRQYPDFDYLP